jgi:hypothetical protein
MPCTRQEKHITWVMENKDVPKATYRYSINVQNCAPAHAQVKVY